MQFKEIGAMIKTLQLVLYAVFVILLFINGSGVHLRAVRLQTAHLLSVMRSSAPNAVRARLNAG